MKLFIYFISSFLIFKNLKFLRKYSFPFTFKLFGLQIKSFQSNPFSIFSQFSPDKGREVFSNSSLGKGYTLLKLKCGFSYEI